MSPRTPQRGVTLVELLISMTIASLLFAALTSLVMLGFNAQASGSAANEQVYRAGFAMERMVSKTRASPPRFLTAKAADTTGEWLAPLAFCLSKTSPSLMETTPDDTNCTGGVALADGVTAFSALAAPSTRPVDAPSVTYTLTVAAAGAPGPVTLTATVRLGGGTQ